MTISIESVDFPMTDANKTFVKNSFKKVFDIYNLSSGRITTKKDGRFFSVNFYCRYNEKDICLHSTKIDWRVSVKDVAHRLKLTLDKLKNKKIDQKQNKHSELEYEEII